MMKQQIETLYELMNEISQEKKKHPENSETHEKLDRRVSALRCAIFELENSR